MSLYRKQRMESLIAQLLSERIVRTIESDEALITITSVEIDEDNQKTNISVAVYPDSQKKNVLLKLNENAKDLAWYLIKKMRVKSIPTLVFK
jgi:ribosome-binding factor A